jgi:hypothetical protein
LDYEYCHFRGDFGGVEEMHVGGVLRRRRRGFWLRYG